MYCTESIDGGVRFLLQNSILTSSAVARKGGVIAILINLYFVQKGISRRNPCLTACGSFLFLCPLFRKGVNATHFASRPVDVG